MSISRILELHELAKAGCCGYARRRQLHERLETWEGRHFMGIAGPRGAGKTVLLRQYALAHEEACYISADTLEPEADLWDVILKSTRGAKTPDFLIHGEKERMVVEVGGRRKGREQFKGVAVERKLIFADTDVPVGGKIPLFLAGFMS